ncbi:hypothetical protein O6H91_22G070800 [Diphasiastrum complanatum]|uniref:Uncharacterized protein n=1 Tax=Diphasiastrum complanatum TaxID=34168 RepID=A0ACC2AGV9_DIPCM|nr:hypothetical protein O6H91_22G070800 [Diphasiastrum complanatum]
MAMVHQHQPAAPTPVISASPLQRQHHLDDNSTSNKMKEKKLPLSAQTVAAAAFPGGGYQKGVKSQNDHRQPSSMEVEMVRQDLMRICNPEIDRPFSCLEDACERLLPYHILAEYDVDEIHDVVEAPRSATYVPLSRFQAWNETMTSKTRNFMALFEKQMATYNSIIRKRHEGDLRGEERYLLEHFLLQEEKQKLIDLKAEIEEAEREAAEARMKEAIAQAEKARAEAQARADAQVRAEAARLEAQARADALQAELSSQLKAQEQASAAGFQQQGAYEEANFFEWGSPDRHDNGNAKGFWKGEDEHDEDGDMVIHHIESMTTMSMQDGWGEDGQLDLNSGTSILR